MWIVFLLLGLFWWYKTSAFFQKEKKPFYAIKTNTIIHNDVAVYENMQILYNSDNISNFSVSKVFFRNTWKETIRKNDISDLDKTQITTNGDFKILWYKILAETDKRNNFILKLVDEKIISITFDYLDNQDGIALEIYHTWNSSENIVFWWKIIGTKEIKKIHLLPLGFKEPIENNEWTKKNVKRIIASLLSAFSFLSLIVIFDWFFDLIGWSIDPKVTGICVTFLMIPVFCLSTYMSRNMLISKLPIQLRKFE